MEIQIYTNQGAPSEGVNWGEDKFWQIFKKNLLFMNHRHENIDEFSMEHP